MPPKGMAWDAATDCKLLLGVLKIQNVTVDAEALAKYMSSDGQTCTAKAIRHRLAKLRAKASGYEKDSSPSEPATLKSGTKRSKTNGADDEESTAKRRKLAKQHAVQKDSDDEDEKHIKEEE